MVSFKSCLHRFYCHDYNGQPPLSVSFLDSDIMVEMQKLNMVNGVLFTGGWAKNGSYYETAKAIFKVPI